MQLALWLDERTDKLAKIHRQLLGHFGPQGPFVQLDPVSQLVMDVIGGKTRTDVSKSTFQILRMRFRCWEAVREAPASDIHDAIREVTFAEVKAMRLKEALCAITRLNGGLTLAALEAVSVTDALAWLERLPGVGRKVAASTLNFSTLRKPALVVDSHHLRVLKRLGIIGAYATLAQTYDQIMPIVPIDWTADDLDEHHQLMRTLGQTICHLKEANCGACPIARSCPTAGVARP